MGKGLMTKMPKLAFVAQLKRVPFDLDLIFAPDEIKSFQDAWRRGVEVEGFPVWHSRHHCQQRSGRSQQGFGIATAREVVSTVTEKQEEFDANFARMPKRTIVRIAKWRNRKWDVLLITSKQNVAP